MKALHHGLWLLVIIIGQSLINNLSFFGVSANLFLVFVILLGFLCGRMQGMVWGMIFGLCYDILIGRAIGTNMLSFMFIGYFSAVLSDRFYAEPSLYVFSIVAAVATLFAELIYLIPYTAMINGSLSFLMVFKTISIELVLNALLILPIHWCMKKTLIMIDTRKY